MSRPRHITRLSLALAAGLLAAGNCAAQSATAVATHPATEQPVPVAQDAPKGSSGDMAAGAAIGLVAGLLVLALIVGSGG